MAGSILPAAAGLLGHTRNCFTYDLLDLKEIVDENGPTAVSMSPSTTSWTVPGSDVIYNVPKNINVVPLQSATRDHVSYRSGSELAQSLQGRFDLQAKYLSVSGKLSSKFGLKQKFKADTAYSFITDYFDRYQAQLDYSKSFPDRVNAKLMDELRSMPQKFDTANPASCQKQREFLDTWGTHVITGVTYGQRYTVTVETRITNTEVDQNLKVDVEAQFNGIVGSGSVGAGIEATQQYKDFKESSKNSLVIAGGDLSYRQQLEKDPTDATAFKNWSGGEKAYAQDAPLHLSVYPLYELLAQYTTSGTAEQKAAQALKQAVAFFSTYTTISAGPDPANGPAICIFNTKKTYCEASFEFTGDPFFSMTRPEKRSKFESTGSTFEISEDGKKITFKGVPDVNIAGWQAGAGSVMAFARFEYICGPNVGVKFTCNENVTAAILMNGAPRLYLNDDMKIDSRQLYAGCEILPGQVGRSKEWQGQDLQGGFDWHGTPNLNPEYDPDRALPSKQDYYNLESIRFRCWSNYTNLIPETSKPAN